MKCCICNREIKKLTCDKCLDKLEKPSDSAADVEPFVVPRILHLTLKKHWFDKIASGEKTEEYREVKPYWVKRLQPGPEFKEFDVIKFRVIIKNAQK